ncbi:MAG: methylamine dehydrogenase (amicyanin) light chain [Pseudomonadales bacterium]|nr:methylamine dehydrogenase (amicyanin) light chain [Pseudomonadales bacterium]
MDNVFLKKLDQWVTGRTVTSARNLSRRNFISRLGQVLVGTALIPVLPVARAANTPLSEIGDPQSCEYWRYCAIDGFLCSCCGGTASTCPPGSEPSPVTWVGTCENPADGKRYIISYNDCCGKGGCGRCFCNRNEGDKPAYYPPKNNDINWCVGTKTNAYHCSTAVVMGVDES